MLKINQVLHSYDESMYLLSISHFRDKYGRSSKIYTLFNFDHTTSPMKWLGFYEPVCIGMHTNIMYYSFGDHAILEFDSEIGY